MIKKTTQFVYSGQLINLAKHIERRVAQIKKSDRAPLYINDLEFDELVSLRDQARVLNAKSLLTFGTNQINALMADVYPMYLSLDQLLSDVSKDNHFSNGVNGAGGLYKTESKWMFKQLKPGKYKFAFALESFEHAKQIYGFGEDILVIHHGYRDIVDSAEIFSETRPGNFEKIYELSCEFADRAPTGTLWVYGNDYRSKNASGLAKTAAGYQTAEISREICHKNSEYTELNKYPDAAELLKLKQESENYLIKKYLFRQK